jgi:hypothetical protein
MSRKYETTVDTQREYFNAAYFNQTTTTQVAKYETTLLKPFFNNPDKWKLAINRARVPLSAIPLTSHNIPFEKWQVGLNYQTSNVGANAQYSGAFVPQYNPKFVSGAVAYNIDNNLKMVKYIGFPNEYIPLTSFVPDGVKLVNSLGLNVYPVIDIENGIAKAYFLSSDNENEIIVYNMNTNSLIASITVNYGIICCMSIDSNHNLQVGSNFTGEGEYWIYNFANYVQTDNATLDLTTVAGAYGSPTDFVAISSYAGIKNIICVVTYSLGNQGVSPGSIIFSGTFVPPPAQNFIVFNTNINNQLGNVAGLITQIALPPGFITFLFPGNVYASFVNDLTGAPTFISISGGQFSSSTIIGAPAGAIIMNVGTPFGNGWQAYAISGGAPDYFVALPDGSYSIFPTTGTASIFEDSGEYNIYTFQQYLNQINLAFAQAFTEAKTNTNFTPTQPPFLVFNPESKLFNLTCEGQYLTLNTDGSNQYQIVMNNALYQKFIFPSRIFTSVLDITNDPMPFQSILLENYGYNASAGTGSISVPQFINMYQEQSTIYALNDLTRIIIGTSQIPVSGDGEGTLFTNTGATNNNSLNMITDFIPDTTTITNAEPIIYVPAGILRWYNLYAQQPFSKIDIVMYYETKDGLVKPLLLNAGEYFSTKLEFKNGPGDF